MGIKRTTTRIMICVEWCGEECEGNGMCTAILSYTLEQRRNTILSHDTCSCVSCNTKSATLQISCCDACQRMNKISSTTPELQPIPVKSPWYHIGIDFVGPITPLSHNGNRYILTLSDYFTKWVEAVALPLKWLLNLFSRYVL